MGTAGRVRARAARVVRRVSGRPTAVTRPAPEPRVSEAPEVRARRALTLLGDLERSEPALPSTQDPRPFLVQGRALRRSGWRPDDPTRVPREVAKSWDEGWGERVVDMPVAADAVMLAKFDLNEAVKLRSVYPGHDLTLAAQAPLSDGTSGITAAVRAHQVVAGIVPTLCPELVAHGEGHGLHYLVERWVDGRLVLLGTAMTEATPYITEGLAQVFRGHGVRRVRPKDLWREDVRTAWRQVRDHDLVPAHDWRRVDRLLRSGRRMRVSWVHGDLVATNVLRTDRGVTLVDWEHSGEAALMHDAAKLHLFVSEPQVSLDAVLECFDGDLAGPGRRGDLTPAEELALVHARFVSRYPRRRARLEGHPRARFYERQIRRQVERLSEVLERAA